MLKTRPVISRHVTRYQSIESAEGTQSISRYTNPTQVLFFLLLHIPLALGISPVISTLHALLTIVVGSFFVLRDHQPTRVIYVAAYIMGAEVLWRSTNARIFWETGKFAVIFLFLLSLLKYGRGQKIIGWPVFYFVLLLPSIFMLPSFDREAVSFNLAGPLALAMSVMLFGILRIETYTFRNILISILAPAIAQATFVLVKIRSLPSIYFGTSSNFLTSGDYGPNQVSCALALGGLAAIYLVMLEEKLLLRYIFLGISMWLLAQSVLTFSREGIWTTGLAVFVTMFFLLRDAKRRIGFVFAGLIFVLVSYFFIFPALDNFTGNKLVDRYASLDTTGRIDIFKADLIVFQRFPLFGVGPGQSIPYHAITFRISNAHTEYSRMMAEHGILGLLALIFLFGSTSRLLALRATPMSKGIVLGMVAWALFYMLNSATRLVAPSFLFGMASAQFLIGKDTTEVVSKNILSDNPNKVYKGN